MTLILAAHCNNGICICSDTRYTEKFSDEISRKCELDNLTRKSHKIIDSNMDLKFIKVNWRVLWERVIQRLHSTQKKFKKLFKKDSY